MLLIRNQIELAFHVRVHVAAFQGGRLSPERFVENVVGDVGALVAWQQLPEDDKTALNDLFGPAPTK